MVYITAVHFANFPEDVMLLIIQWNTSIHRHVNIRMLDGSNTVAKP
jgi:hypothetical protein